MQGQGQGGAGVGIGLGQRGVGLMVVRKGGEVLRLSTPRSQPLSKGKAAVYPGGAGMGRGAERAEQAPGELCSFATSQHGRGHDLMSPASSVLICDCASKRLQSHVVLRELLLLLDVHHGTVSFCQHPDLSCFVLLRLFPCSEPSGSHVWKTSTGDSFCRTKGGKHGQRAHEWDGGSAAGAVP